MNTLAVFSPCDRDGLLGKKARIKVNPGIQQIAGN
jgi:hypothetical protein